MTVSQDDVVNLMSFAATFTLMEDAIQNLIDVPFDDVEIATLDKLEPAHRMRLTARLAELSDEMREALRELDGRVLQLSARPLVTSEQGS